MTIKFKKILKIWGIVSLIFILLILLSGMVISLFFQEQVKNAFENEINRQLATEFRVDGRIKLSVIRNFPNASITFHDVVIEGSLPGADNRFLEAKEVSLVINLWKMIRGKYDINKVLINKSTINLVRDKYGKVNYDLLRETEAQDEPSGNFNLDIQNAAIKRTHIRYADLQNNHLAELSIDKSSLSLKFQDEKTMLQSNFQIHTDSIFTGGYQYLVNQEMVLNIGLEIDRGKSSYLVTGPLIKIGDDEYSMQGEIKQIKGGNSIDLKIKGDDIGLQSLIAFVPGIKNGALRDFDSEGRLEFNFMAQGNLTESEFPHLEAEFSLADGKITHHKMRKDFKNVQFAGKFSNGASNSNRTSRLDIDHFTATLDDNPFEFQFNLLNFTDPNVSIGLTAQYDLNLIMPIFETEELNRFSGSVYFDKISVTGRLADITNERNLNQLAASGKILLNDVGFEYQEKEFENINAQLELHFNQLEIPNFQLETGHSDILIDGRINNFLMVVSGIINHQQTLAQVDLRVRSEELDIDDLLFEAKVEEVSDIPSGEADREAKNKLNIFTKTEGNLVVDIKKFNYREFDAEQLFVSIHLSPEKIEITELQANTLEGRIEATGETKVLDGELLLSKNKVNCYGLNIEQLFADCENFDQNFITDEHLRGKVWSVIDIRLLWNKELVFLEDEMEMKASIEIQDGELINFEPLEDLGSFVKVKELNYIKFHRLNNDILIKNSNITIPAMVIKSTALNLILAGEHTFNNDIEYYFKINLMDVLARKMKFGKMDLEEADKELNGIINLYVAMTGTVNDYSFKSNKKLVKEKLYKGNEEVPLMEFIWDEMPHPSQKVQPGNYRHDTPDLEYIDWDTDTLPGK